MRIRHILSQSPNKDVNLEACKELCFYWEASDNANIPLFNTEKKSKINNCKDFKELFEIISEHICWDEHSILTQIIDECNSDEAKKEFTKYQRKGAISKSLEIISSNESYPPPGFEKFCVIIDKPYRQLTVEKYEETKEFIFKNLDTKLYCTNAYIRVLFDSLHLEWYVTTQAIPHMIKIALKRKNFFKENYFIFMKIGNEVIIDMHTEQTLAVSFIFMYILCFCLINP